MTQRVLITGIAGFIGSNLAEMLLRDGDEVCGIDNYDPYYDVRFKEQNNARLAAFGAETRHCDVCDEVTLGDLVKEWSPDVIVHLAARAGVRNSIQYPAAYVRTNLNGFQNVLDASIAADVGRVVMASTSSVYGACTETPFSEEFPAVEPLQPYAASKRAAEMLAHTYHHLYGLETTVTRFFTVYGPYGRPDMMPYLVASSISSGREIPLFGRDMARDWTFVEDICRGLQLAVRTPLGFEILNLGRGHPVLLGDFISAMERVAGASAKLIEVERPSSEMAITFADNSRARDLLGFAPSIDVNEGVERFWDWFVTHRR